MSGKTVESSPEANGDELKTFVTTTLRAVFEAVAEAQAYTQLPSKRHTGASNFEHPNEVTFDVAITAKSSGGAKGGLKLEFSAVGANVGSEKNNENSTMSRIQFKVPFLYRDGR